MRSFYFLLIISLLILMSWLTYTASPKDIFEAVKKGDVQSAIKAGADVNAKDKKDKSVLDYARENPKTEIVTVLIKAGAK